jgi:DNA-binding GntR family transcriptional regulator
MEIKNKIYESIKADIINCCYKPDEPLEEKQLTEKYGVSRTPIREVISMLKQEGWLENNGRKGAYVSKITLKNVKDLFQLRYEIEPIILRFAFNNISEEKLLQFKSEILESVEERDVKKLVKIDDKFHDEILNSSNNDLAIKVVENIMDQTKRFRYMTHTDEEETLKSAREHIQLIDFILEKNLEKSLEVLKRHIDNNQLYFVRNINF